MRVCAFNCELLVMKNSLKVRVQQMCVETNNLNCLFVVFFSSSLNFVHLIVVVRYTRAYRHIDALVCEHNLQICVAQFYF